MQCDICRMISSEQQISPMTIKENGVRKIAYNAFENISTAICNIPSHCCPFLNLTLHRHLHIHHFDYLVTASACQNQLPVTHHTLGRKYC
jgi:hypothetical protein